MHEVAHDFFDITSFPMPQEFEEQISGDDVESVEFYTDSFWQEEESIILAGGKLYRQLPSKVERILDVDEFEFYAHVTYTVDEEGELDEEGEFTRTEKHEFTGYVSNDEVVSVRFDDFHIIDETIPED